MVELHYLDAPLDELVRRVQARTSLGTTATVPITRADLEGWLQSFEPPDAEEMAMFDPPFAAPALAKPVGSSR